MSKILLNMPYKIISIVQKNIDYLINHPKHLAWCLMNYQLMHDAVRMKYDIYTDNPKYIFLDKENWPSLSGEQLDLLYDAWAVSVSSFISEDTIVADFPNDHMTLYDWENYLSSENYMYCDSYKNKYRVSDALLCSIGSEYGWNENGFIVKKGIHDNVNVCIFYGYSQAEHEIPVKIKNAIKKVCSHKKIESIFANLYNTVVEYNHLSGFQKNKLYSSLMSSYSKMNDEEFLFHVRNAKNNIFQKSLVEKEMERIAGIANGLIEKLKDNGEDAIDFNKMVSEYKLPFEKEKSIGEVFYPFCSYSNISKIPDNAHESYIKEAVRISNFVLSGKPCVCVTDNRSNSLVPANKEMVEISKRIIERFKNH